MAEGEIGNKYNWRTGEVYICYWNRIALKEYMLGEEFSLPLSGEDCLSCSLEKCLECSNYIPSTRTYPQNK